ncbi:MAG: hypothetical protein OXH52_00705 [Gammaproteobacteria bacterium]|nr:hypothetical protein [Gammaproteobacteria bacterium]
MAREAVEDYCRQAECPALGNIAWILGKAKDDLAFLDGLCSDDTEGCRSLVERAQLAKAYVGTSTAPPTSPHETEISFVHAYRGDLRPWTAVEVGDKALWGQLNSGSYAVEFSKQSTVLVEADFQILGKPWISHAAVEGSVPVYRRALLWDFTMGSATEDRIPAVVNDESMEYLGVGMNALLRYSEVCLSWVDATLYLGKLGPCRGGENPFAARFLASGEPIVEMPAGDGTSFKALIHTGAAKTACGERFARRTDAGVFRIGNHPDLQGRCSGDDLPEGWTARRLDAVIGMDTLVEFDSMGWKLNPLRMFFVPKDPMHDNPQQLMDQTMLAVGEGDLRTAWESYRKLHVLERTSELARSIHKNYCGRPEGCPDIGLLAWILGMAKGDLAFLDGHCDEANHPGCVRSNERVEMLRAYLDDAPTPADHPAHEVEIAFIHAAEWNDFRPWTTVEIGGKELWAMVNTGETPVDVSMNSTTLTPDDFQTFGEPRLAMKPDGIERMKQDAVLRNFGLGPVIEGRVPSQVKDTGGDMVILGMAALLRYPRVCFSFAHSTLHLGSLGPCAGGEAPFAAALSARGQPFVNIDAGDGEPLRALIDTGAPHTDCQDRFMRTLGVGEFRFGTHPGLVAHCRSTNPTLRTAPWIDVVIGMDDLVNFDAFGWELSPFRMYFVPAQAQRKPETTTTDAGADHRGS